jgi:hypothetical protein
MNIGIPKRAFFQVAFPCLYRADAPAIDGTLSDWDATFLVPDLTGVEGKNPFADVYMAWNDEGLFFAIDVQGAGGHTPDVRRPLRGDGLQVWIDTRDVRNAHRGSRYCHHFCFWPEKEKVAAGGRQFRLRRARGHPRLCDSERLDVASKVLKTGYRLEAHIPAVALTGYDPEENNRLGFTYLLRDKKLGRQVWTAEEILPVSYDPSLWGTAELVK